LKVEGIKYQSVKIFELWNLIFLFFTVFHENVHAVNKQMLLKSFKVSTYDIFFNLKLVNFAAALYQTEPLWALGKDIKNKIAIAFQIPLKLS
jgi:hypothetical protein